MKQHLIYFPFAQRHLWAEGYDDNGNFTPVKIQADDGEWWNFDDFMEIYEDDLGRDWEIK